MEKPFLYTDLIPPDSTEKIEDIFNSDSVPIKQWKTGRPYKIDHYADLYLRNSVETATNESYEGMLNYLAENMPMEDDDEADQNEDPHEEDEDGYESNHDQEDRNSNYSNDGDFEANIRAYFSNDQDDEVVDKMETDYQSENYDDDYEEGENEDEEQDGEEEEEEEEEEESDEENERERLAVTTAFEEVLQSPRIKQYLDKKQQQGGRYGEQDEENEEDKSVAEDLMHIMNDYSELMTYLQSPRDADSYAPQGSTASLKSLKQHTQQPVSKPKAVANAKKSSHPRKAPKVMPQPTGTVSAGQWNSNTHSAQLFGVEDEDSDDFLQPVRTKKPPAKKKAKPKSAPGPKVKTEAGNKLKALLSDMVERRRLEEEEQSLLALKAIAKRKKFKEALLDKAMKARQAQVESSSADNSPLPPQRQPQPPQPVLPTAGFLAPTKAFIVQSKPVKTAKQVLLTDEDLVRAEEAKHEQVASIRRKFKEQHKKILQTLTSKNKEGEKKLEDEQLAEQRRKEKYRLKIVKLLAARQAELSALNSDFASHILPKLEQEIAQPIKKTVSKEKKAARVERNTIDTSDLAAANSDAVAGSALQAVRKRAVSSQRQSDSEHASDHIARSQSVKHKPVAQLANNSEVDGGEDAAEAEVRRLRKIAAKLQQAKISSYLAALAEQKHKDEEDKKKKDERAKKRVALLGARVLQEGAERKQMSANDHPKFQAAAHVAEEPAYVSHYIKKQPSANIEHTSSRLSAQKESSSSSASTKSSGVKVTAEMAEAIVSRLQARQTKSSGIANQDGCAVPARDFADWKRKNSVPSDAKVFAMTGWYPCVKQALLDRGWHFNADNASPYFHLKWTLRSIDVSQDSLQPWQLTNHYLKNVAITTKAGLIKSLQSLVWLADVDAKDIIPRGYDLSIPQELQAFMDDFRCQKADSVLKKLYKQWTGLDQPPVVDRSDPVAVMLSARGSRPSTAAKSDAPDSVSNAAEDEEDAFTIPPVPDTTTDLSKLKINTAVFQAACSVLERQIRPYEDAYIDDTEYDSSRLVTDLEWELLLNYDVLASVPQLPEEAPEPVDGFLRDKEDADQKPTAALLKEKRRQQRVDQQAREEASSEICRLRAVTGADVSRVHHILCSLMLYNRKQNIINGKGDASHNLWIVKPAAKSRGRGISTFIDLNKLLKYVEAGTGFSTQWVVQKYIENPLCIAKRKFDLRQWVVVTDWNPLTIYFYDEFYARFSVEEYSTEIADLENSYIHLVNNSIGKNSENFHKTVTAENGEVVDGYMWSQDSFRKYVQHKSGSPIDLVSHKIQPRMKDIAKWSLMCASEMIEHRKNSWELYGFDYMVDDEYNAWLIEINSSPACDYSTKTTERYVQKALVELLSVVLDVREWEDTPKKSRGPKPDTGGWECIYQGPLLDMPMGAFGTDMTLKGEAYKNVPRHAPQVVQVNDFVSRNIQMSESGATANASSVSGARQSLLPRPPPTALARNPAGNPGRGQLIQGSSPKYASQLQQPKAFTGSSGPSSKTGSSESFSKGPAVAAEEEPSPEGAGLGFDDSDDEETKAAARERRDRSSRQAASKITPKAVNSTTAAIPIKVFSMDF